MAESVTGPKNSIMGIIENKQTTRTGLPGFKILLPDSGTGAGFGGSGNRIQC